MYNKHAVSACGQSSINVMDLSHLAKFDFELHNHDPVINAFIDSDVTNRIHSM